MALSPYFTGGGSPSFQVEGLGGLIAGRERNTTDQMIAGGRNIGTLLQWVSDQGEKHQATDDAGKAAKLMMSGENSQGQSWLNARGVTPEEQKTWGTKDWANAGAAFHQDQVSQEADTRIKTGMAQFAELAQRAQANAAFAKSWQQAGVGKMVDALSQGRGPIKPEAADWQDFAQAATAQPEALTASAAAPYLQEMAGRWAPRGAAGTTGDFVEDPITGSRFAQFGRTVLPSGINPAKGGVRTTLVDDGRGGEVPVLINPRTGAGTQLRTGALSDADLLKSFDHENTALRKQLLLVDTDAEKQAVAAQIANNELKIADLRKRGNGPDGGPAGSSPDEPVLPMPTDKTKMEKGKSYQTAHGVYTWDGKQLVK